MSSIRDHFSTLSQALDLRAYRHQVLASNIANADTPQFKARDFSFEGAMQNALAGKVEAGGIALAQTSAMHLQGGGNSGAAVLKFRTETQSAVDGNTVDMDVERTQMTENALQYQVLTQLIGDRFKNLRTAMSSAQG